MPLVCFRPIACGMLQVFSRYVQGMEKRYAPGMFLQNIPKTYLMKGQHTLGIPNAYQIDTLQFVWVSIQTFQSAPRMTECVCYFDLLSYFMLATFWKLFLKYTFFPNSNIHFIALFCTFLHTNFTCFADEKGEGDYQAVGDQLGIRVEKDWGIFLWKCVKKFTKKAAHHITR